MMARCIVRLLGPVLLTGTLASQTVAQTPPPDPLRYPSADRWEAVRSLGQPPVWKPYLGLGFGVGPAEEARHVGPTMLLGMYRDIGNPVHGMFGVSGEVYGGQRGETFDAGVRLAYEARALFTHVGLDYNLGQRRADFIAGISVPPVRGGLFRRGGEVRVDWLPWRDHTVIVGVELPLHQPLLGRTRPRRIDAPLPPPPLAPRRSASIATEAARDALVELHASMVWIVSVHSFFWRLRRGPLSHRASLVYARNEITEFRHELEQRLALMPGRSTYALEVDHYHDTLARAFGHALVGTRDPASADRVAALARRVVLEEIVLPYNRTVGQFRRPDTLGGLVARARARFLAEVVEEADLRSHSEAALYVFETWLGGFESVRAQIAGRTADSRRNWLPLALALRSEDHRTQAQIDALVEIALGRDFTRGNATRTVSGVQFQAELTRSIREAQHYHVLWVHDYRGWASRGEPDRTGHAQTVNGYLRALLEAVRAYDSVGRIPTYVLILEHFSYSLHGSRLWLDLLERPLTHRVRLPARHAELQREIDAVQDSLVQAVRGSWRLAAEVDAFGPQWAEQLVKVHVNVTYPSDFSFRASRLLGVPFAGDNLMRDHRKIVIRDVSESSPWAGEVILTGSAVGDHYATPLWDERAVVMVGPVTIEAKHEARRVLETNGLRPEEIPPPLRPSPYPENYADELERHEALGATARALQVHNRTGFDTKEASFAQMLLYDLAPAGTVIYVPDSLWLSFEWMAQLISAALRGCEVIIVAPSRTHSPSDAYPQMTIMQELVSRVALVREELGGMIRAAGGDLRLGVYARQAPLDDVTSLLAEARATYAAAPFLAELFPDPRHAALPAAARAGPPPADARVGEAATHTVPQLHRKTQLLASRRVFEALVRHPGTLGVLEQKLENLVETGLRYVEDGTLPPADGAQIEESIRAIYRDSLSPEEQEQLVLYFMIGSLNKDVRSMALDGEVLALVAGAWATQAYLDFTLLSGGVTWIDRAEQLEPLLPPYRNLLRWIGRRIEPVL